MIYDKEFVWHTDHYVHHMTLSSKIEEIQTKGLKPKVGENCQRVGDNIKAIHFFDGLGNIPYWLDALYPKTDVIDIEILRFNLKYRKWTALDTQNGDFYIQRPVKTQGISYLRIYDGCKNIILLNDIEKVLYNDKYQMVWENIENYQPYVR